MEDVSTWVLEKIKRSQYCAVQISLYWAWLLISVFMVCEYVKCPDENSDLTQRRSKFLSDTGKTIFSCDQAALRTPLSVCLSVCLSVRLSVRPSHVFDNVPVIVSSWNFQESLPLTDVMSVQKVKVRGQRSRSQRSRPNLAISRL